MPLSTALSDGEAREIQAFAKAGGIVIADGLCGLFDRHANHRPVGALDDFFGVARAQVRFLNQWGKIRFDPGFHGESLAGKQIDSMVAESELQALGRSLARASISSTAVVPALIIQPHGAGQSVFVNAMIGDYNVITGAGVGGEEAKINRAVLQRRAEAQSLYRALLGLAGVIPQIRVESQTPGDKGRLETLIARHRDGESAYVLVLPGYAGAEKLKDRLAIQTMIRFPKLTHLYDIRAGKYLGHVNETNCTLTEGDPQIFAMMPYPVSDLKISISKPVYRAGENVDYEVSLHSDSQTSLPLGRHVIFVNVAAPDNQVRPAYNAKLEAQKGTCKATIPLAYSDMAGTWKLTGRDVATGMEGSATFVIRADEENVRKATP
jgi:hypothetical protein